MRLTDLMEDAVADATANPTELAATARSRGVRFRRRRRAAAVLGGAGVAAVVTLGVAQVLPGTSDTGDDVAAGPTGTTTLDGRSTTAVLHELVDEVADGEFGGYAGQGLPGGAPDTFARLELTPAGEGLGVVQVNVQGRDMLDSVPRKCTPSMRDCSVRTLPNGDRLLLATTRQSDGGLTRGASVLSERRVLTVAVSASNGFDLGDHWQVTRPDPVLTYDQLTAVATHPLWAFDVPAEYAETGAELAPYDDLDVPAQGDWTRGRLPAGRG